MKTPEGHQIVEGTGTWRWKDHNTLELVDATVIINVTEVEENTKKFEYGTIMG